jgi:hypothetical protein
VKNFDCLLFYLMSSFIIIPSSIMEGEKFLYQFDGRQMLSGRKKLLR